MSGVDAEVENTARDNRPWLSMRGVSKRYDGVHAIRDISIDVIQAQVHGIIGPNGAGKSTLVKIMAGAVALDEGTVAIHGVETHLQDPAAAQRHRLVLMPQEITIIADASLTDNVTLGAESARYGIRVARDCRRRTTAALEAVGLDLDVDAVAGDLSAVQQRLLMLARAIDRDVQLLILDEPTAGLGSEEAAVVTATVRKLSQDGVTVVYVSHDLSEVATLCDRVTCLREGQVVAVLEREELTRDRLIGLIVDVPAGSTVSPMGMPPGSAVSRGVARAGVALEKVSGARLRDIDVTAHAGEVTGVTGLLGSGVSELVSIIIGAARPRAGRLLIEGRPCMFHSPADALDHDVAYVSGDRARVAFPTLTIRENVSLPALASWWGRFGVMRRKRERTRVRAYLQAFAIRGDAERSFSSLSGGNQQRALVARLMAAEARVLVLDEPTVGVDVGARSDLWNTVKGLARERTVIVASSDAEELVALCDRVICLHRGEVRAVLSGSAITEHEIARSVA